MNRDVIFPDDRVEEKRSRSGSGTAMNLPIDSQNTVLATSVTAAPVAGSAGKANPHVRAQSKSAKTPPPPRDIYQEALLALRGRYLLAAVLAIIGAAAGVCAVIRLVHPVYKSEGLLQIALQREAVLNETDQNRPVAMFDAMLRAQVDIIRSRGLLERALQTTAWQAATGKPGPAKPQQIDSMADDLSVEHPGNTDHLKIVKLDGDPQVAAATVNAIIEAYSKTYESRESSREQERLEALQKEKAATELELADARARLEELVQTVAGGDVEARYDNATRRMTMLDTLLANVKLQQGLKQNGNEDAQGVRNLAIDRLARNDPGMKALSARKRQLDDDLDTLLHGPNKLLENNPSVIEKRRQIAKADDDIQQYATQMKDLQLDIVDQLGSVGLGLPGGDLEHQSRVISAMKADLGKEIAGLVKTKGIVSQLKASAARLGEDVDRYDKRIRDLRLEASIGGRLSVISSGEIALKPFYDPRQKLAVAGGMIGGGIPVAILVLIGLMSGKYRFVNETSNSISRTAPLLGMLPSLPNTLNSMRQVADAAHSVHQIRAMLQMGEAGSNRSVYMVTSATSGEGKTNLTVALGLSFAAAGCKTLIVDCDLVGQGVTRGFRAEKTTGLREALACGSARGFVKRLPQGLRLLTAGTADTVSGWTLSSAATNRMLTEVRRYYDVVLIDTGPILGSVEASILAPAVDGVILTVSRGQQRVLVDRAMQLLGSLGAETAGFVFNRAKDQDFKHTSYYSSATQFSSLGGNLPEPRMEDTSEVAAFGPLVRSVATFMRTPSDGFAD